MRVVSRIVAVLVGIAVIVFAIANRGSVEISLSPLPFAFHLPVYVAVLGALLVGFVAGLAVAWVHGAKARRLARSRKSRIAHLERELEQARPAGGERSGLPTRADAA